LQSVKPTATPTKKLLEGIIYIVDNYVLFTLLSVINNNVPANNVQL
jgi:hypothetical protein